MTNSPRGTKNPKPDELLVSRCPEGVIGGSRSDGRVGVEEARQRRQQGFASPGRGGDRRPVRAVQQGLVRRPVGAAAIRGERWHPLEGGAGARPDRRRPYGRVLASATE